MNEIILIIIAILWFLNLVVSISVLIVHQKSIAGAFFPILMFLPFIPFLSGIAFVQDDGTFKLTSQINKINIYNFRRKKYTLSIKDKSGNDIKISESQMIKIMSILERG